ncbi:MAG: NusG domain II-containing protein [Candidatus Cloacimonetes bacterium]|nr:NusG domain II-containing protein [Candidatus Cloacimonadota bacterium]
MRRLLTRSDVALIVVLLLLAGTSWALLARGGDGDTQVAVYVDDTLYGRWPLTQTVTLEPRPGVVIEIAAGRYRMAASPCERQICVKQGWQSVAPVVCVPQRVMVVAERKREMMLTR